MGHPTVNYDALYCYVLYCSAMYCTVLYCTAMYCTVLYCYVLYCTVLYFNELYLSYDVYVHRLHPGDARTEGGEPGTGLGPGLLAAAGLLGLLAPPATRPVVRNT